MRTIKGTNIFLSSLRTQIKYIHIFTSTITKSHLPHLEPQITHIMLACKQKHMKMVQFFKKKKKNWPPCLLLHGRKPPMAKVSILIREKQRMALIPKRVYINFPIFKIIIIIINHKLLKKKKKAHTLFPCQTW